jgi:putative oxidoreductase
MFMLSPVLVGIVLLLVRVVLAVAFLHEALLKARDMRSFAKNDGVPLPLAWTVTIAELAAALSFFSGVLVQWAGLGVILLMLITMSMVIFRWHGQYWAQRGGYEYDLILLTLAAVMVVFGPGLISVSALFGAV